MAERLGVPDTCTCKGCMKCEVILIKALYVKCI